MSAIPLSTFLLSQHFALVAASIPFTYMLLHIIYNLFLSPLSAIPGPWYAAISNFWLTTHVLRFQQCKTIHQLFEHHGPVVRVGPNKVVFRDLQTCRGVYSVHKFDKSPYYKSLLTNDNDHAMTTLDHATHSIRRKAYAPHYTPSNIVKFEPEMHAITLELMNLLEGIGAKNSVECLNLFRHLMVDVVVLSSYGHRLGALTNWAKNTEDTLSTSINNFPIRGILRSTVPAWAWSLVCKIPNRRWRQICNSDKIMAEFVSARVYEMRAQMLAGNMREAEKQPMLQRMLQYRVADGEYMPDHDIISECMGHMIAAADTTSTTLSYFFWELSRRPDIVKKLQAELDEAMRTRHDIPSSTHLQALPYLNAFVKEGLRLYSAAPSLLERVVPDSISRNSTSGELFDLMGYGLPPGTIVSTQAWSMHRNPTIFPSPDSFSPERWLPSFTHEQDLVRMSQSMMPFGTGSRLCGGHNLAQLMLKIAVAAVVRNFNIVAPPETTEQSMDIRDSFVIFPAAMECRLTFVPRQL
ncbi:cytochrome P450 [Pluteus cervinus]|uniref:Cytochrome P450 n=1 Tax=Pluteus cervinus TaxID=181527 RepID=A0ACD3BA56_9AGAR|nr:cytochrome P450 [Pluteus cervinus]